MKIKADDASSLTERGTAELLGHESEVARYRMLGHSDEWINWWLKFNYPRRPMSTQTQAKHFIISMDGPAASKFAKKYSQLKLFT